MLYAIIATDVANSLEKRLSVRPAHVERLKALQAEGRLVIAGPHPAVDSNDPGGRWLHRQPDHRRVRLPGRCPGLGQGRSVCGGRRLCRCRGQTVQTSPALIPVVLNLLGSANA